MVNVLRMTPYTFFMSMCIHKKSSSRSISVSEMQQIFLECVEEWKNLPEEEKIRLKKYLDKEKEEWWLRS